MVPHVPASASLKVFVRPSKKTFATEFVEKLRRQPKRRRSLGDRFHALAEGGIVRPALLVSDGHAAAADGFTRPPFAHPECFAPKKSSNLDAGVADAVIAAQIGYR